MRLYDILLAKKLSGGGGGGSATLIDKNISANGTYNASSDNADGYKKVVVSVPNTYVAGDEGKVVSSGALVSQTSATYTSNNTYDTTLINSVTVNVPQGWTTDGIADLSQPSGNIVLTVSSVGERAFFKRPITSVYSTTVTQIDNYSFANCSGLKSVDFPNLTNSANTGKAYIFQNCSNLESVNLPLFKSATSGYVFQNCSKLTEVFLPSYNNATGSDFFSNCTMLTTVDFGSCSKLDGNCFKNDPAFNTLILRRSTITPLNNTSAFSGTPFANGGSGGTIYIPKSLYDHLGDNSSSDYQHATNWSTIQGYGTITWQKIEGSIYEL